MRRLNFVVCTTAIQFFVRRRANAGAATDDARAHFLLFRSFSHFTFYSVLLVERRPRIRTLTVAMESHFAFLWWNFNAYCSMTCIHAVHTYTFHIKSDLRRFSNFSSSCIHFIFILMAVVSVPWSFLEPSTVHCSVTANNKNIHLLAPVDFSINQTWSHYLLSNEHLDSTFFPFSSSKKTNQTRSEYNRTVVFSCNFH